jgi:hypothetical protein
VKLTLTPVLLAVVCVVAGCASAAGTGETAPQTPGPSLLVPALAHLMAAPTAPPAGTFRTVLTLPVVKSSPVGKGDAWSVGSYKKTDSSVTVDWLDTPSAECGRAHEVRLDETISSVTIQLVPGKRTVPVCSSDAHSFTMDVRLSAPIGSRPILQQ